MSVSLLLTCVCLSFRKSSCFLDGLIIQGQYVLCARDRVHIETRRQSTFSNDRVGIQMTECIFKQQSYVQMHSTYSNDTVHLVFRMVVLPKRNVYCVQGIECILSTNDRVHI